MNAALAGSYTSGMSFPRILKLFLSFSLCAALGAAALPVLAQEEAPAASEEAPKPKKKVKKSKKKEYDYSRSKYKSYRVLTGEEGKSYRFDEKGNPIRPADKKKKKKPAKKKAKPAPDEEGGESSDAAEPEEKPAAESESPSDEEKPAAEAATEKPRAGVAK